MSFLTVSGSVTCTRYIPVGRDETSTCCVSEISETDCTWAPSILNILISYSCSPGSPSILKKSVIGFGHTKASCPNVSRLCVPSVEPWLFNGCHRGDWGGSVHTPPTFLIPSAIPFRDHHVERCHEREPMKIRVLSGSEFILLRMYSILRISLGLLDTTPLIVPLGVFLVAVIGIVFALLFWSLKNGALLITESI